MEHGSAYMTHHIMAVTNRQTDRRPTALVLALAPTINAYITEEYDWSSAHVMLGRRSRRWLERAVSGQYDMHRPSTLTRHPCEPNIPSQFK